MLGYQYLKSKFFPFSKIAEIKTTTQKKLLLKKSYSEISHNLVKELKSMISYFLYFPLTIDKYFAK